MLARSKLQSSLLRLFANPGAVRSVSDAESEWSDAYTEYATDAEDVSGDQLISSNPIGFRRALNFQATRSARVFAQQIESGFVAYWTGAVFAVGTPPVATPCPNVGGTTVFSSETTSLVTAVTPGVMFSQVLPVLIRFNGRTSAAQKASELAGAIHRATTTAVIVLITGLDTTPGPGGPLPITNTCTIS